MGCLASEGRKNFHHHHHHHHHQKIQNMIIENHLKSQHLLKNLKP